MGIVFPFIRKQFFTRVSKFTLASEFDFWQVDLDFPSSGKHHDSG